MNGVERPQDRRLDHPGRVEQAVVQVLFRRITPKRWTVLTALQASGPQSVRELARLLDRDVKNVHGDVQALIEIGLIECKGTSVRVPFDEIRAAFRLTRAA